LTDGGALDPWAEWLVRTRFAGWSDEDVRDALAGLEATRDRVLDRAAIRSGDIVVDVGAGTGLLTFGALTMVGDGWVVAVDPSVDCVEELRRLAHEASAAGIQYLLGDAETLPLPDASVDVVITRSGLIYLADTSGAAAEFHRVLRSGGRVSVFEPVNRRGDCVAGVVDWTPLGDDLARRVREEAEAAAATSVLMRFDEERFARELGEVGFADVEVAAEEPVEEWSVTEESVDLRLDAVGAPGQPTLRERWQAAFEPGELEVLVGHLKGLSGTTLRFRRPQAFLAARKT
jgi:ubiquinone/menaquinone biosynthesis C-methylase UbiE